MLIFKSAALAVALAAGCPGASRGQALRSSLKIQREKDAKALGGTGTDLKTGMVVGDAIPSLLDHRVLMKGHNTFRPLPCNSNPCSKGSTTWSREKYDPGNGTVVIPCGKCVVMDYEPSMLSLPHGLDVMGRIIFPDGYKLAMETPFVRVQGELVITSTRAVSGEPDVSILITGTDESIADFVPAPGNEYACSSHETGTPSLCKVGLKPFVVAGGKLSINGIPDKCPTWLQLDDVVTESLPLGCDELVPESPFDVNRGIVTVENENGSTFYRHSDRSDFSHSITVDIDKSCLIKNSLYHFSAKIRTSLPTESSHFMLLIRYDSSGPSEAVERFVYCPPISKLEWTSCEGDFLVNEAMSLESVKSIVLKFRAENTATIDYDDMTIKSIAGPISGLVLGDRNVASCWAEGADILIASHTDKFDGHQVRQIDEIQGTSNAVLHLSESIPPTVTKQQSPHFATEVALLSRNIVFKGALNDEKQSIGAHFMVMHTPNLNQILKGVDFVNFGQQGKLGRYPIHFHMCGSVDGSVVEKNTIRQSNQRCVVIHGTHNLTVADNVAFDTKGHCYMTEDGVETNNVFRHNIGVFTKSVEEKISRDETDDEPSTFWCTNPMNSWVNNSAAGSEGNGWWFELRREVRGPSASMKIAKEMNPRELPLEEFRGNVAHSNSIHGLRTYPNGYVPETEAVFYDLLSFKNRNSGVFFHNSHKMSLVDGILGDNRRIQADFDRANDIRLQGTNIIGHSGVLGSHPKTSKRDHKLVGVQIHGFRQNKAEGVFGASIQDVSFSGFCDSKCDSGTVPIDIDRETRSGQFDYWTSVQGIKGEGLTAKDIFDFCDASDMMNVYLTDVDSSTQPSNMSASGASSIISSSFSMKFLDPGRCIPFPKRCLKYCGNTCLRTVSFAVSPAMTGDITLRLRNPEKAKKLILKGAYWNETGSAATDIEEKRIFAAALPPGRYVAHFLDSSGSKVWPTFVEQHYEDAQCSPAMSEESVELVAPKVTRDDCQELLKNGDGEMSEIDHPYWLHQNGCGVELTLGGGINGSNAIADVQKNIPGSLGQLLDTRCLSYMEGQQYEVKVWIMLERDGKVYDCDKGNGACPTAKIRAQSSKEGSDLSVSLAKSFVRPFNSGGWNLLHGVFTVGLRMSQASKTQFLTERGSMMDLKMYVDNASISAIPQMCDELVFNGGFETGDSRFWDKANDHDRVELSIVVPSKNNFSLKMHGRRQSSDGPVQLIRTGCMVEGERYLITSRFKLEGGDSTLFLCDTTSTHGTSSCPRIGLRSWKDVGLPTETSRTDHSVALADHSNDKDGWGTITGIYRATDLAASAEKIMLHFDDVHESKDLVIDNVSIKHLNWDCSELIVNGDAEYDDTAPRFWRHFSSNSGEKIEVVNLGGSNVLFNHGRKSSVDGMHQYVDETCLSEGTKWMAQLKIKVVDERGRNVFCDPSSDKYLIGCPSVRITAWTKNPSGSYDKTFDEKIVNQSGNAWAPGDFNVYRAEFEVTWALASSDRVSIGIRGYKLGWVVYVDNFSVKPSG